MTREEAIKYFKRHLDLYCVDGISREAEEMAIQSLSQEPIKYWIDHNGHVIPIQPPVTQKSGKWIDIPFSHYYKCSECDKYQISATNYCPICGAKMVEPQERESDA